MSLYNQTDSTKTWQERLRLALQKWTESGQDEDALLQGTLLAVAAKHLAEQPDELSQSERAFIQASLDLHQRQAEEADVQYQHELDKARQTNRRLRRLSLILVGVAAVAIIALIFAIWQSTLAQARHLAANAQLAFNEGNTHLAVLLSLEAQNLDPAISERLLNQTIPTQARHAPGQLIGEHKSPVLSVAWHPDGIHLASASSDQSIRVTPQVFTRQPCYWLLGGNLSLWQWKAQRNLALYRPTCPNRAFIPIPFGLNADYLVYTLPGRFLASGTVLSGLAILYGLGVIFIRARRKRRYIRK